MEMFLFIMGVFYLVYILSDLPNDIAHAERKRAQREKAKQLPPSKS